MVCCTSCNRAMLVRNCYLEINTTFQLEKDDKQYNVMANQNTISNYLNKDIFQYKDNVDELMEKLLLLENVDFELSTNGRIVTEILDHKEKPDEELHIQQCTLTLETMNCAIPSLVVLSKNKVSHIIDNIHIHIFITTLMFKSKFQ